MFSPQENEPQEPEERQENTNHQEQKQAYEQTPQWDASENASYEQGYRGYDVHAEGEKVRPAPSISSRQWIWIIIAVVVLLVIGGIGSKYDPRFCFFSCRARHCGLCHLASRF